MNENNDEKEFLILNHKKPFEERVNDLVSRITLEEKIFQMINTAVGIRLIDPEKVQISVGGCQPGFSDDGINSRESSFDLQGESQEIN